MGLLIIVIIIGFWLIKKGNKLNYIDINEDIQYRRCLPQAILLKNGQVILVQIDLSYRITDTAIVKSGINIFKKLEYESIIYLRKIVDDLDDVDDVENIILKSENDLKKKLSEVAQDFETEIIELHINFGNKNEFDIEKNNLIKSHTIDEIRNTNFEEENNAEYKFEVPLKTLFGKRRSRKTKFKTKISLLNNKLKYNLSRKYENTNYWFKNGDRKYNSFTEGIQEFYIEDILSVKYKIGFSFALNFNDFIFSFGTFIFIYYSIISLLSLWKSISAGVEKNLYDMSIVKNLYNMSSVVLLLFVNIFCVWFILYYFTCKCIEIKYKSEEGIKYKSGNIKKIVFPISRIFFGSVPTNTKQQVDRLLEEIKQKNQNVRMKKDRLKWIFISYIIIFCIINVFVPLYLR